MSETTNENMTVGEAQAQHRDTSVYDATMRDDIIKTWNDRRLASNIQITSLTPFVQLIGVFNQAEYERLFAMSGEMNQRPVVFTPDDLPTGGSNRVADYVPKDGTSNTAVGDKSSEKKESVWDWIQSELKDRFINLYLYEGVVVEDEALLRADRQDGIIMARAHGGDTQPHITQVSDPTGGVGITSLDVDYGGTNSLGSRKFNLRLTVNNPSVLDDKPEFSKLSTMQGEFILMYGWSNPHIIEGYSYGGPPVLMNDPSEDVEPGKQMMRIPLDGINSGGMWNASKVNVSSYDFSFNEMGQLEINVGFMDKTTMFFNTTRVASIAPTFRKLFANADYDPHTSIDVGPQDFTKIELVMPNGEAVTLEDLVSGSVEATNAKWGSDTTGPAPTDLAKAYLGTKNVPGQSLLEALSEVPEGRAWTQDAGEYNDQTYWKEVREREHSGFPYAGPGVRAYQSTTVQRITGTNESGEPETEETPATKVTLVSYYLGWVLEGMRLSLNSQNRSRVREGDTTFMPTFKYLANETGSSFQTASQDRIRNVENRSSYENQIINAIERWEIHCQPPNKHIGWRAGANQTTAASRAQQYFNSWNFPEFKAATTTGRSRKAILPSLHSKKVHVQNGIGVIVQGERKTKTEYGLNEIANRIFPTPEGILNSERAWRGKLHTINLLEKGSAGAYKWEPLLSQTDNADNGKYYGNLWNKYIKQGAAKVVELAAKRYGARDTSSKTLDSQQRQRLESAFTLRVFKPDWYEFQKGKGGSPDGYDPANPTKYMAKDRKGTFYFSVEYTFVYTVHGGARQGTTTTYYYVTMLYSANTWLVATEDQWSNTQEEWYGYYNDFLRGELERLLRKRVGEIEKAGLPIESIYAEPIDLDYLTGQVWRNWNFYNSVILKPWSQAKKGFSDEVENMWDKLNRQNVENDKYIAETEEVINIISGDIEELVSTLRPQQEKIEELTGGRYERVDHQSGPEYLADFKPWIKTERGGRRDGQPTPEGFFIPLNNYAPGVGNPVVTLEWIIWSVHKIPTDNFQEDAARDMGDPGNSQIKWSTNNPDGVDMLKSKRDSDQHELDDIMTSIVGPTKDLAKKLSKWYEHTDNLFFYEEKKENLTADIREQAPIWKF